jgi:hypothetical protein
MSTFLHEVVYVFIHFLHTLLNVLVQIANKTELRKHGA